MDPGTILAVATASIQAGVSFCKYLQKVKSASQDIRSLAKEVEDFCKTLQDSLPVLEELEEQENSHVQTIKSSIRSAEEKITSMQNHLDGQSRNDTMRKLGLRALKWPFKSEETKELLTSIERSKSTVILSLSNYQTLTLQNMQRADKLRAIEKSIAELPYAQGAALHDFEQEGAPFCTDGTRIELLEEISAWAAGEGPPMFWLCGMAGTGKSTIAHSVAMDLDSQQMLGASFFFSRGNGNLANAKDFVPTIATQLAYGNTLLKEAIADVLTAQPQVLRQGLITQWNKLVLNPLQEAVKSLESVLVVDALDECADESHVKTIIKLLFDITSLDKASIRVFITSRPEIPIRVGFSNAKSVDSPKVILRDLRLDEIPRPLVERDLKLFLNEQLSAIRQAHDIPDDWPKDTDKELLITRAEGLFISVGTACRFIAAEDWSPQSRLTELLSAGSSNTSGTSNLDKTYHTILQSSILSRGSSAAEVERLCTRFQNLVGTIVVLFDAFTLSALAEILQCTSEDVDLALGRLHSVIYVPDSKNRPVRLLHTSFRDYLIDETRCIDARIAIDPLEKHADIAISCLKTMSKSLKRNICQLKALDASFSDVTSHQVNSCISPALQYSSCYWITHIEASNEAGRRRCGFFDAGAVHNFLEKHFLHWLEVMTLTKKFADAMQGILKLEDMTRSTSNSYRLQAFLRDARSFMRFTRPLTEQHPLQTYASSLVFSPSSSLIRKVFSKEQMVLMKRCHGLRKEWPQGFETIGTDGQPLAICYSADGNSLAAVVGVKGREKDSNTVEIFDPRNGACKQSFSIASTVVPAHMQFSNDGRSLIIANEQVLESSQVQYAIQSWDWGTGSLNGTHWTAEKYRKLPDHLEVFRDKDRYRLFVEVSELDKKLEVFDLADGHIVCSCFLSEFGKHVDAQVDLVQSHGDTSYIFTTIPGLQIGGVTVSIYELPSRELKKEGAFPEGSDIKLWISAQSRYLVTSDRGDIAIQDLQGDSVVKMLCSVREDLYLGVQFSPCEGFVAVRTPYIFAIYVAESGFEVTRMPLLPRNMGVFGRPDYRWDFSPVFMQFALGPGGASLTAPEGFGVANQDLRVYDVLAWSKERAEGAAAETGDNGAVVSPKAISPNRRWLLCRNHGYMLFDLDNEEPKLVVEDLDGMCFEFRFSNDSSVLAVTKKPLPLKERQCHDVIVYDLSAQPEKTVFQIHGQDQLMPLPNRNEIALRGENVDEKEHTIEIWNWRLKERMVVLKSVSCLYHLTPFDFHFCACGSYLVSFGDNICDVWKTETWEKLGTVDIEPGYCASVVALDCTEVYVSVRDDDESEPQLITIDLASIGQSQPVAENVMFSMGKLARLPLRIFTLPDRQRLAVTNDREIGIWNIAETRLERIVDACYAGFLRLQPGQLTKSDFAECDGYPNFDMPQVKIDAGTNSWELRDGWLICNEQKVLYMQTYWKSPRAQLKGCAFDGKTFYMAEYGGLLVLEPDRVVDLEVEAQGDM